MMRIQWITCLSSSDVSSCRCRVVVLRKPFMGWCILGSFFGVGASCRAWSCCRVLIVYARTITTVGLFLCQWRLHALTRSRLCKRPFRWKTQRPRNTCLDTRRGMSRYYQNTLSLPFTYIQSVLQRVFLLCLLGVGCCCYLAELYYNFVELL